MFHKIHKYIIFTQLLSSLGIADNFCMDGRRLIQVSVSDPYKQEEQVSLFSSKGICVYPNNPCSTIMTKEYLDSPTLFDTQLWLEQNIHDPQSLRVANDSNGQNYLRENLVNDIPSLKTEVINPLNDNNKTLFFDGCNVNGFFLVGVNYNQTKLPLTTIPKCSDGRSGPKPVTQHNYFHFLDHFYEASTNQMGAKPTQSKIITEEGKELKALALCLTKNRYVLVSNKDIQLFEQDSQCYAKTSCSGKSVKKISFLNPRELLMLRANSLFLIDYKKNPPALWVKKIQIFKQPTAIINMAVNPYNSSHVAVQTANNDIFLLLLLAEPSGKPSLQLSKIASGIKTDHMWLTPKQDKTGKNQKPKTRKNKNQETLCFATEEAINSARYLTLKTCTIIYGSTNQQKAIDPQEQVKIINNYSVSETPQARAVIARLHKRLNPPPPIVPPGPSLFYCKEGLSSYNIRSEIRSAIQAAHLAFTNKATLVRICKPLNDQF